MKDRVPLNLESVLAACKGKSLEQKYGYLQAAYQDLWDWQADQIALQAALLRRALEALKAREEYDKFTSDEVIRSGQSNMIPGGPGSMRFEVFIKLQKAWPDVLISDLRAALEDKP